MAIFVYPPVSIDTSGLATEAKQDVMISELQDINTELDSQSATLTSIDTKVATETTLATKASEATLATRASESTVASIDTKVATETTLATKASEATLATRASETTVASIDSKVATETTLAALDAKVTAVDTTGKATEAKQDDIITQVTASAADLALLEDRLAGSLVPETHDYLAVTYVAAGNGAGEIETVTYRTGGATGTIVATLTLAYDGSDRLTSVTRS